MRLRRILTLPAGVLLVAALANDRASANERELLDCAASIVKAEAARCSRETEAGAGTAGAYAACIGRAEAAAGKTLQHVYDQRVRRSSAPQRDALRAAQRTWLAHQKTNCEYEKLIGQIEGPSFAYSFLATCLLRSTAVRICEIRAFDEYFPK